MKFQTLGSLIDEYGGLIQTGPFGSQLHQHEYVDDGIPAVMPKDIQNGRVNENTVARIPERKAQELSRHILKAGSIVFPRRGEINKCAYIDESQAGFLCGTGCLKIEPPEDVLLPRFLFYYLGLRHVVEWLERNAVGTTMLNLNSSIVGGISVPVIDRIQQEKIIDILFAYDGLIENNRRRIDLLEQSARMLYKEWFISLQFPGHEHIKVREGVPDGWRCGTVEDLGEIITGKTPSTKVQENYGGDISFVKTPDMHAQIIVTKTEQLLSERGANTQENKFLPKGAVMVSCIGTVGVVSIAGKRCQTNQQINSVVCYDPIFNYYAYYALLDLKPRLESMGGGATMPNVNKAKFTAMPVMIPDKKILALYDDIVASNFEQIEALSVMNEKLSQARDLLLPRLMNGEIPV